MTMTDPVADLLTRIRNGVKAKKPVVEIPASGIKKEILRILKTQGYVRDYIALPDNKQGMLRIYLKYGKNDEPVIKGLRRISKPGLRHYASADEVKASTKNARGIAIVSTSSGVMTNFEATQKQVGGEMLARCW